MNNQDFSNIAKRYEETSLVQNSAADILLALLNIQKGESVLDIGCGTGNLTKKLYDISNGMVMGIDPSQGMIEESKRNYGSSIIFENNSAENITFKNKFNVIFCNSAFQWINDADRALGNFYSSLIKGGRIGIQAPAKREYCPNFIEAINNINNKHEDVRIIFNDFVNPWLFLDSAEEYALIFKKKGFSVPFAEIQTIETYHSPEEVYTIFASGAIAGYLNKNYYQCEINDDYIHNFQSRIKEEFVKQAKYNGKVKLVFNRIFLVGIKS